MLAILYYSTIIVVARTEVKIRQTQTPKHFIAKHERNITEKLISLIKYKIVLRKMNNAVNEQLVCAQPFYIIKDGNKV